MKQCIKCSTSKPLDQFFKRGIGRSKEPRGDRPEDYRSVCKECSRIERRQHRKPEQTRKYYLKRHYNMTPEEYDTMLIAQDGVCYICGGVSDDGKPLAVDHNHVTGVVRKLLCRACNHMIGNCREDVILLERAIEYIKEHKE